MDTFHHYSLISPLSHRLGCDVYLAHLKDKPEHKVVLKVFDAECIIPGTSLSDFRQMETRLRRLKHPHIVAVHRLGIEQGRPYVASEYQPGGSLRHYLELHSSEHLLLNTVARVVSQIGEAVAFAHTQGIVHQDIRPENIFLSQQGQMLLADFSLENIIYNAKSESSSERRSVSYLSPEQVIGVASPASDQYSLGCLLYELITGILPNPTSLWQSSDPTTSVAFLLSLPPLPGSVEKVMVRALAVKPEERYPDVATFLTELNAAVQAVPPVSPMPYSTIGSQQILSKSEYGGTEEVPSLASSEPFKSHLPQNIDASASSLALDAFITTQEWSNPSFFNRLAIADGQEDVLILSNVSDIGVLSKEHIPAPEVQPQDSQEVDQLATLALTGFLEKLPLQDQDTLISKGEPAVFDAEKNLPLSPAYNQGNDTERVIPPKVPVVDMDKSVLASGTPQIINRNTDRNTQSSLFISSLSNWKRSIVLLGVALLVVLGSFLFIYFNPRVITIVKHDSRSGTSIAATGAVQKQATGVSHSSGSTPQGSQVKPTLPPVQVPIIHQTPVGTQGPTVHQTPVPLPTATTKPGPIPSSGAPIGNTIWLKAVNNNEYVSARQDHSDSRLEAMSNSVNTWEKFTVINAGNGYIALQSLANDNYVCAQFSQANNPIQASCTFVQSSAEFRWIDEGNGLIALQIVQGTVYASVQIDHDNAPLYAQNSSVQGWNMFLWGKVS